MHAHRFIQRRISDITFSLLLGATFSIGISGASPASAQATAATPEEAQSHLTAQNDKLKEAFALLPKRYGADPAKEKADIDNAKAIIDGVVASLEGKHKAAPNAFAKLQSNVARLRSQLQVAEKAQKVSALQKKVYDLHRAGKPADEALWIEHDKALAEFSAGSGPGWQPVLSFFSEKSKARRADQKRLEDVQKQLADKAATEAANQKLQAARTKGNAERKKLMDAIARASDPLSDDVFSPMIAAANEVAVQDKTGSEVYLTELRHLRVQNDFLLGKKARGEAIANHFEGGFATGGSARKKTTKLTVRAESNWCYGVVMRSVNPDPGAFRFMELKWSAKKTVLQPWRVEPKTDGFYRIEGFCSAGKAKVSGKLAVDSAPKGKLHYVIVGWPRGDFPAFLQTYLELLPQDRCDFEAKASLFETPVPGTLISFQSQPYVIVKAGGHMNDSVTLMDPNGERLETTKTTLGITGQQAATPMSHRWRGCPDLGDATAKGSKRLGRCIGKIERTYASKLAKAQRAIDKAKTDAKRERAEDKLAALEDKETAAKEKKCDPIEAKLKEQSAEVFARVLSSTAAKPVKTPTSRAQRLINEAKVNLSAAQ